MTIEKISVIGTGTMGSGIVQAFAQAGRKVTMKSRSEASNARPPWTRLWPILL